MFSRDEFVDLLRDELAVLVTADDLAADVDQLPDWNSGNLIRLVVALERATGRRVPVDKLLTARSLETMYRLATT
jgi:acyl carrier protein